MVTLDEKVKKELVDARKYAQEGNASVMKTSLSLARKYAQKVGQDISEQVTEVERLGYTNAVPVKLVDATKYAQEGNVLVMKASLSLAQNYAQKVGQDISGQVTEIESISAQVAKI